MSRGLKSITCCISIIGYVLRTPSIFAQQLKFSRKFGRLAIFVHGVLLYGEGGEEGVCGGESKYTLLLSWEHDRAVERVEDALVEAPLRVELTVLV